MGTEKTAGKFVRAISRTKNIFFQNKVTAIWLIIVVIISIITLLGPKICPYDYKKVDFTNRLSPPSRDHVFGTDQFGRDILSRIIMGGRVSMLVGLGSALLAAVIGVVIGLLAGWKGRFVDSLLMRVMDVILSFPSIIIAIALSALVTPNITSLIVIISIHSIPQFARTTRGAVLSVKEMEYIESAGAIGQKPLHILVKHVLPNCFTPIIVYLTFATASAINTEAALSFLGIGIQPPEASWGVMLNSARSYVLLASWMAIFPGLIVTLMVLACNLLGDGIRDALDPRVKGAQN